MSADEKATPLPDAIHLGNTDIEIGRWEPKTTPVERPAHPGHEHLLHHDRPELPAIVGYRKNGTPIRETAKGMITTQAFIFCSACRITIKATGGPMHDALCLNCFKGQRPAP